MVVYSEELSLNTAESIPILGKCRSYNVSPLQSASHIWRQGAMSPVHASQLGPGYVNSTLKKASARFFFALANRHDGFDSRARTQQPWNAAGIDPHRDV